MTRALSGFEDLEVDLQELPLESGVRSLLCSDGVFAVLADGQIADVFRARLTVMRPVKRS